MTNEPVNLLPKKSSKRSLIFISLFAGLFLLCALFWSVSSSFTIAGVTLHPREQGLLQTVKNFIFADEPSLKGQAEDRINILLLGMGGAGHDGPYLTDTNLILSIKPSTKEVAMISIPRDLGVTIPNQGIRKINYAGAYGEAQSPGQGGEFARQVFENTFGQSIPYYIRVDFKAFTDMIDAVGGVQVNVPTTFTDTQFPGENFSFRTVHFDAGPQTMNGETALTFARSRHGNNGEGGDFARARRQQLVILSLKQKLLSAGTYTNPLTIQQILSSLKAHVTTNLSITELTSLARMAGEFNSSPKNLVLDNSPTGFLVSTTGESGAFLLFPKTGDYTNVNTAIAGIFSSTSTPSLAVTPALIYPKPATSTPGTVVYSNFKVELQNGTWRVGLAARMRERLQEKGFSVITVGNSLKRPIEKTAIYLLNPAVSRASTKALSDQLKAPILTVLPEWLTIGYNNPETTEDESGMKYNQEADVLVILGADTKE